MTSLQKHFSLNPNIVFLNHGSFGATPRPVFTAYQDWQCELEKQPVQFISRQLPSYLEQARLVLADYLHARADDLVFIPNATFGVNIIAHSLKLETGDEILASDHEYGACDNVWEFICRKTGASYMRQHIPMPANSADDIVDHFWQGVTPRTKLIFVSHITSPTALRLPVKTICQRAKEAGILTLIDGAHAPGQIALDIETIGADFYFGNCHKWMLAPKGSAFLHTRREIQKSIKPLIVGWGWGENREYTTGSQYLDSLQLWGTIDPSAYLSVTAAIQFQKDHHWQDVRRRCHQLVSQALNRISNITSLASAYPNEPSFYRQMAVAPLPFIADLSGFQKHLYEEYRVEIPCTTWNQHQFIRISVQGYNTQADIDTLLQAFEVLLPRFTTL